MSVDRKTLALKQKKIKIKINGQYPIMYLVGHHSMGFTRLCKDHMLEMKIEGGWPVDSFNMEFTPEPGDNARTTDYKITHIGACSKCTKEGKGPGTEENITIIANQIHIRISDTDDESDTVQESSTKPLVSNDDHDHDESSGLADEDEDDDEDEEELDQENEKIVTDWMKSRKRTRA